MTPIASRITPIALLIALLAAVGLFAMSAAAAPVGNVEANLSPGPTGGATVRLVLRNNGATPVDVPKWLTGAHGITEPVFAVTRNGVAAQYTGMIAKRRDPGPTDMVTIAPGDQAAWTLDVATAYALSAAGAYAVQYGVTLPDGAVLRSNLVGIEASAAVATAARAKTLAAAPDLGQTAVTYAGCGGDHNTGDAYGSDQAAALASLTAANDYAVAAKAYFTAQYRGTRYVKWFGAYDATRWNTASSHFTSIQAVTGGTSAGFDCSDTGCGAGVFAFVYPNAPYTVHLCSAFWSAELTGTDSRAGTLIHEISHFTAVAATDDWVYGQGGAANLAISNPGQAVTNADNHEYFAENTPVDNATYTPAAGSYNVGAHELGTTSAPVVVVLTSSGNRTLSISSVSASGDFTVSSTTCVGALAVSATCNVFVTFTPTVLGARTGTLTVNGNLDSAGSAVALSGIGAPLAGLTPAFGTPTPTADGFTVQITNYDPAYNWAGIATAGGNVTVSNTGLVTVTGVAPGASSTATVTTTRTGYADGNAASTSASLAATPVAAPTPAAPATEPAPEATPAPAAPVPVVRALSAVSIPRAPITVKAPLVSTFAAAPGTTYTISAQVGRKTLRGACRVANGEATCTLRIGTVGSWRVSITPTANGRKGKAVTAVVRVRRS